MISDSWTIAGLSDGWMHELTPECSSSRSQWVESKLPDIGF